MCTTHGNDSPTLDAPSMRTIADLPMLAEWRLTTPREQGYVVPAGWPAEPRCCAVRLDGCGLPLGGADAPCVYLPDTGWLHPSCYVRVVLGWTSAATVHAAIAALVDAVAFAAVAEIGGTGIEAEATEDDENEPERCSTCEEPIEDGCECRPCAYRRCGEIILPDEWCRACERCERHCNCWTCDGCRTRYPQDAEAYCCLRCNTCETCCDCERCANCEDPHRPDEICTESDCGRCRDCCDGHSSTRIPFQTHDPAFRFAEKANERQTNRSRRLLGAELEVAAVEGDPAGLWEHCEQQRVSIVEDGSLQSGGFELNTVPAAGDRFLSHITALCDRLNEAAARVDASCGFHLHIDARDFTFYDMRRLVMLYQKIEPVLFATQPKARRASNYCAPCGEMYADAVLNGGRIPKESKAALLDGIYADAGEQYKGKAMVRMRRTKWGAARYRALNLHSWVYRGTVECRLHTGTVNATKIIAWGMLWAAILDFAMARTEAELNAMQTTTLADRIGLVLMLAPTEDVREYVLRRIRKHGTVAECQAANLFRKGA